MMAITRIMAIDKSNFIEKIRIYDDVLIFCSANIGGFSLCVKDKVNVFPNLYFSLGLGLLREVFMIKKTGIEGKRLLPGW